MDRGRLLSDAANVLVQVAGGPGMTLSEVEALMQDLNRHIDDRTQIFFGTSVDGRMGNRLAVTLISALASENEPVAKPISAKPVAVKPRPPAPVLERKPEPPPAPPLKEDEEFVAEQEPTAPRPERPLQTIEAVISTPEFLPALAEPEEEEEEESTAPVAEQIQPEIVDPEPPQPRVILPQKKPMPMKEAKQPVEKIAVAKQEILQFESITRGRFEKSEPTIIEGQDLDVPTFLRKNVRVK
jgi:cell division protein FtsZ